MTKIAIFKERIKVLEFQFTQFYSITYKDHPDGLISLLKMYNKSYSALEFELVAGGHIFIE